MLPVADSIPRKKFPIISWIIIGINVFIFSLELELTPENLIKFFYYFGVVPARYTNQNWAHWIGLPIDYSPFFTSLFIHGNWMHLIGNMWTLWLFGTAIEERIGHFRFIFFYLLCGIISNLIHLFFNLNSTIPAIGASGAIAGIMGAYFILYPTASVIVLIPIFFLPYFIELPAILYLGVWFLTQLFSGTFSIISPIYGTSIAWWAHVGGFLAGSLLIYYFIPPQRKIYPDEFYIKFT